MTLNSGISHHYRFTLSRLQDILYPGNIHCPVIIAPMTPQRQTEINTIYIRLSFKGEMDKIIF